MQIAKLGTFVNQLWNVKDTFSSLTLVQPRLSPKTDANDSEAASSFRLIPKPASPKFYLTEGSKFSQ